MDSSYKGDRKQYISYISSRNSPTHHHILHLAHSIIINASVWDIPHKLHYRTKPTFKRIELLFSQNTITLYSHQMKRMMAVTQTGPPQQTTTHWKWTTWSHYSACIYWNINTWCSKTVLIRPSHPPLQQTMTHQWYRMWFIPCKHPLGWH